MIVYATSPSMSGSLTPVTVTVWGTYQLVGVKTRGVEAIASAGLLEERPMVTLAVGWLWSTIAKLALPPASVVTNPDVGLTVIPAVSSSRLVTVTSGGFSPE